MGDEQILAVLNRLDIVGKLTTEIERVTAGVDGLRVRMDSRFDALAAQIHEHNTRLSLIEQRCERHDEEEERARVESERRERKISQLSQKVDGGPYREPSVNIVQPSLTEVLRTLEEREEKRAKAEAEREEARAKSKRAWVLTAVGVALPLLATPTVRQCIGEQQAAKLQAAVERVEQRVEQQPKVVKVPVPQPVPVPVNGGEK